MKPRGLVVSLNKTSVCSRRLFCPITWQLCLIIWFGCKSIILPRQQLPSVYRICNPIRFYNLVRSKERVKMKNALKGKNDIARNITEILAFLHLLNCLQVCVSHEAFLL